MKKTLKKLAVMAAVFAGGWFAHWLWAYDPRDGLQWRFVDAARRGDLRTLDALLLAGAEVDAVPTYAGGAVSGFPALLTAAGAGQSDAVRWLLSHGADPNRQHSDSRPLEAAEGRAMEAKETVAILKSYGAVAPAP